MQCSSAGGSSTRHQAFSPTAPALLPPLLLLRAAAASAAPGAAPPAAPWPTAFWLAAPWPHQTAASCRACSGCRHQCRLPCQCLCGREIRERQRDGQHVQRGWQPAQANVRCAAQRAAVCGTAARLKLQAQHQIQRQVSVMETPATSSRNPAPERCSGDPKADHAVEDCAVQPLVVRIGLPVAPRPAGRGKAGGRSSVRERGSKLRAEAPCSPAAAGKHSLGSSKATAGQMRQGRQHSTAQQGWNGTRHCRTYCCALQGCWHPEPGTAGWCMLSQSHPQAHLLPPSSLIWLPNRTRRPAYSPRRARLHTARVRLPSPSGSIPAAAAAAVGPCRQAAAAGAAAVGAAKL